MGMSATTSLPYFLILQAKNETQNKSRVVHNYLKEPKWPKMTKIAQGGPNV